MSWSAKTMRSLRPTGSELNWRKENIMKSNTKTIEALDLLRGSYKGVFPLQLLAARKLEQNAAKKFKVNFSDLPQESVSVFKIYDLLNALAEHDLAFQADEQILQSLSGSQLSEIIKAVRKFNLEEINYDFVSRLAQTTDLSRGKAGGNVLPTEICELMVELAGVEKKTSVICPFNDPEWLAFKAAEKSDDVTIYNEKESPLPHLLNILLDKQVKIRTDREPSAVYSQKHDVFLAKPTFGPDSAEEIRHIVENTSGRAVILVLNNFLFRTVGDEFQLKKEMIVEKAVETVVTLPGGVLQNTNLPFSLLVVDRSVKTEEVLFVKASGGDLERSDFGLRSRKIETDKIIKTVRERRRGDISMLVSSETLRENEFNFSPERYLLQVHENDIFKFLERAEVKTLEEIAELYRPQSVRDFQVDAAGGEAFLEVSVSNIAENGYVFKPKKEISLAAPFGTRFDNLILQAGDVLLPIKGSVGKVGIVPPEFEGRWIANQSLIILRLKKDNQLIDPILLYSYLASEIGQTLLQTYTSGSAISFIQMRDVRQLKIPIPPVEVQQEIINCFKALQNTFFQMMVLQAETIELRQQIKDIFVHKS